MTRTKHRLFTDAAWKALVGVIEEHLPKAKIKALREHPYEEPDDEEAEWYAGSAWVSIDLGFGLRSGWVHRKDPSIAHCDAHAICADMLRDLARRNAS